MPLELPSNQADDSRAENRAVHRRNARPARRRNALLPNSMEFTRLQAFGEVYHEERGGAVGANVEVSSNNFRTRVAERVRDREQARSGGGGDGGSRRAVRVGGREDSDNSDGDSDGDGDCGGDGVRRRSGSEGISEGPET